MCGLGFPRRQRDDHRFVRRTITVECSRIQRNKRVGLGVVGSGRSPRDVIFDDAEVQRASHALVAVPEREQIDYVAVVESERGDVVAVQEHHPSPALDSPVPITEPVDRGVELVVTAQRLQQQMSLGYLQDLDGGERELPSPRLCLKGSAVARRVRKDEPTGSSNVDLVSFATGDHAGNVGTDIRIVLAHCGPVDPMSLTQSRLRNAREDRDLRSQILARRLQRST